MEITTVVCRRSGHWVLVTSHPLGTLMGYMGNYAFWLVDILMDFGCDRLPAVYR